MPKLLYIFIPILIGLVFLLPPSYVSAASISISNTPLSIDQSQDFEIDVGFSCSGCGDSYIRGVFYAFGKTSYFGYIFDNNGVWSNAPGGNCTTYFKIAKEDLTAEGSWSGKLKFKPDKDSSYYSGPGEFSFKLGRYTPSCSSPSVWSNEVTIAITGPTPTPTAAPTAVSSSIPTKTPIISPSPSVIMAVGPVDDLEASTSSVPQDFVFSTGSGEEEDSREKDVLGASKNRTFILPFLLSGAIFSSICAILLVLKYKLWKRFI